MIPFAGQLPFPTMPRIAQETPYYCGPAVLQMLLGVHGILANQMDLVYAGNAQGHIKERGMIVPELAAAVKLLAPSVQFWYKPYSTISELSQIVNIFGYPVGIEWQGVFDYPDDPDDPDDEEEDDDPGHYSVITLLDTRNNQVMIADPDRHYAGRDRRFSVLEFERRWWDINEIFDPTTNRFEEVDDFHMMYIITRKEELFPEHFLMKKG